MICFCPSQPVSAECVVKKIYENSYLSWRCDNQEEAVVHCNDIVGINCEFGEMDNVTAECRNCNSDLDIIISTASFNAPDIGASITLECNNSVSNDYTHRITIETKGKFRAPKRNMHTFK